MFKEKTVFVVGAGASHEFGLPLGRGLSEIVRARASEEPRPFFMTPVGESCWLQASKQEGAALQTLRFLREGILTQKSIDRFLHFHKDDLPLVRLGKSMIAYEILRAENESRMRLDPVGEAKWIMTLWHAMSNANELADDDPASVFNNVSFVCFNYDRCLEFAFEEIIKAWLARRGAKGTVERVLSKLKVLHPYGTLSARVAFGKLDLVDENFIRIDELSSDIKLFTEAEEGEIGQQTRQEIGSAAHIIFLGFGYEPLNMNILNPIRQDGYKFRVSGTVFGLSKRLIDLARNEIGQILNTKSLELEDETVSVYMAKNVDAWALGRF